MKAGGKHTNNVWSIASAKNTKRTVLCVPSAFGEISPATLWRGGCAFVVKKQRKSALICV
jgi:hypothetical protein